MDVEQFEILGLKGRDFVIYSESGVERFSARLFSGSTLLTVEWTDSLPWVWHRLREAQRLAGGPSAIRQIEALASDEFEIAIKSGRVTADDLERNLSRALGGRWSVNIVRTRHAQTEVIAKRVRD